MLSHNKAAFKRGAANREKKDVMLQHDDGFGPKALASTPSTKFAVVVPVDGFGRPIVVPALVADVGPRLAKRFANFFGGIR